MEDDRLNEMSGSLATETIDQVINEESEVRNTPIEEEIADQPSDRSDGSDESDGSDKSDESDKSDKSDRSDQSDQSDGSDSSAEKELAEMTEKVGAAGVLEIIRGNRNMIIDQLIAEAKAEQGRRPIPSGISSARKAISIFDIAGMA